jgi:hypothetical protein
LQGIVRELPLFDPELDPRQLLRAIAAGRVIGATATGTAVMVPHYRFAYLLERARQVTGELKQLGSALLSAIEKQDAEQLALLHNTYEGTILTLTTLLKQKQQEENEKSLAGLQKSQEAAQMRYDRYQDWATGYISVGEQTVLNKTKDANDLKQIASLITTGSAIAYLLPNIFGLADGGSNFGGAAEAAAGALNFEASILDWAGQMTLTKAQYDRRQAEWQLQADMANYELQQLGTQIDALTVRQAMAAQELAIHQQSIAQTQELAQFYRQKFTSQELYQWMMGEVGVLYFQTYQLALDLARMAERAFQYERNTTDTYVTVNGWDSLHKGLLVGEALTLNLNQLDKAYIEQNDRQLEIEKTISLGQLDPLALLQLKRKGYCEFQLSEAFFDLDFPGHYLRKIKSISLSIPAVVGPYQNIHATLTQQSNHVVITPDIETVQFLITGEKTKQKTPDSSKLQSNWQANQQVALSRGVNDAGLFELNFNDERYLPFEGTGAVSSWTLRMPKASNRFDFDSISDVIMTVRYTACDGGETFRQDLLTKIKTLQVMNGYRLFTARQINAASWQAFRSGKQATMELSIEPGLFPLNLRDIKFGGDVAMCPWPAQNPAGSLFSMLLPGQSSQLIGTVSKDKFGWEIAPTASNTLFGKWQLQVLNGKSATIEFNVIDDLLLIVPFQGTLNWNS